MKYAFSTDIGKRRKNNEDAVFACDDNPKANVYIVADGMGGHKAGEVASNTAIRIVASLLCGKEPISNEAIINAIESANKEIFNMSRSDKELEGMGTTIVIAIVNSKELTIAHVGDSRAYLITKDGIQRLTIDHSWVQELINSGSLSQSEAKDHPQKNIITRAVGISRNVKVDILKRSWSKGNKLLLCTDGLNTHLEDNEILDVININKDIKAATSELINSANNRGGSDNVTVVLVENNVSERILK